MEAHEIYELIQKVQESNKPFFLVKIEGVGYIEMTKKDVIDKLYDNYCEARLKEFSLYLKSKKVMHFEIAEKLGIHPVQFAQMLSGHVRKNKKVGDSIDFIHKAQKITDNLCSK